jgi:hypothetical protein
VDYCIQENGEVHVAIEFEWDYEANNDVDGAMVEDMQERDLSERFSHDEKPCVKELPEFLRVENPKHVSEKTGIAIIVAASRYHRLVTHELELRANQNISNAPHNIASCNNASQVVYQQD